MKRSYIAICFAWLLLLSACGVSSDRKEEMQNSLYVGLTDALLKQDSFVAFAPSVELREVERGAFFSVDGYRGLFSCSFTEGEHRVFLSGSCGFDKDGFLATMPDGRLAVDVVAILVDSRSTNVSTSIYNLPVFFSNRGK
ncbi:MAG: hypothetical protein NC418_04620 [Muribaculaceae bacterium]|nr:hypothetical protein [Muribaculaceae bacterium]